jgi:tryptophanyl-tRNA synthetase
MNKDRVLTGIRANGDPHIGNYLGAMLPMVEVQKHRGQTHDMFFFVPDLHSFTTPVDHDTLYQHSIRNLKYYVAAGMDFWAPGAYLYRQSYIPAHAELTWILDCFAYMGEMGRMTQFKEKNGALGAGNGKWEMGNGGASVGLFNYPVLMAADILLYNARYVPVGEDQRQHLELTRDLCIRINNKFSEAFPGGVFQVVPEDWNKQLQFANRDSGVRIRSLRNPEKKMSKSVDDPAGTIGMLDDPAQAAKKVMSATTDSVGSINFDWGSQPGICNLLQILALMSERPVHEVAEQWQDKSSYGDLKKATAEKVESFLRDFQTRIDHIDEAKLLQKLEEDEAEVRKIADATLLRVQQAVGLRPRNQ